MQYENSFSIGDKLEIEIDQKQEISKVVKSQLLEISKKSQDEYYISIPMEKGRIIPISVGEQIYVYYAIESKGVFCFRALVVDRAKEPVLHLRIKQVAKTQKIQRRDYFRLEMMMPVEVLDLGKNVIGVGSTKDLSGGGIRFVLPQKLEKDEEIYVNIALEGKKYLIKGIVLRRIPTGEDLSDSELAVKFTQINEDDRNSIIKYLFKHQRILRQKGLI